MIRVLGLLLVFALGLTAAAAVKGRMHHLRMVLPPDRLPVWAARVPDSAGLLSGKMDLPATRHLPALQLGWRAVAPGAEGWAWTVTLDGAGVAMRGRAVLGWWPDRLRVSDVVGSFDLAGIGGIGVPVTGTGAVQAAMLEVVDPWTTPRGSGEGTADLRGVTIAGSDFGSGRMTGALVPDGPWFLDLMLSGGASPVTGRLSGVWGGPVATIDLAFDDDSGLPDTLRGLLQEAGRPVGDGWRWQAEVTVQP